MIRTSKKARQRRKEVAELDYLVKQIVLFQDGEKCARCGKAENLQAAHIRAKGVYGRIRFYTYNVIILCLRCHLYWWHKEPAEAVEWCEQKWPGRLQRLAELAAMAPKIDMPMTRIALEAEFEELHAD